VIRFRWATRHLRYISIISIPQGKKSKQYNDIGQLKLSYVVFYLLFCFSMYSFKKVL
jgi:hypothetical protein